VARRDYKHRATRRKKRQPAPVWIWLLVGYLAGAVSVGFLWVKFAQEPEGGEWIGAPPRQAGKNPAVAKKAPPKKPVQPPSFDFYNLLPDQEVVVPEEELARPGPPPAAGREKPRDTAPVSPRRKYMLQVSSVRSAREADALKAKLAFLGLQAQVSKATIKGVTWYRVRLGPYSSKSAMQQARKRLAASGYPALPIALK